MSTQSTIISVDEIAKHIDGLVKLFKDAGMELNSDGSLKSKGHSLTEDLKWNTCPPSTGAYNTQLLVNRGIKLPDHMEYNHYGQACISPQDLAVLVENRQKIVEQSRTIVTACATLMHKLTPLSKSDISCNTIDDTTFQGITTAGKAAICNFMKNKSTGKNRCKIDNSKCVDNA